MTSLLIGRHNNAITDFKNQSYFRFLRYVFSRKWRLFISDYSWFHFDIYLFEIVPSTKVKEWELCYDKHLCPSTHFFGYLNKEGLLELRSEGNCFFVTFQWQQFAFHGHLRLYSPQLSPLVPLFVRECTQNIPGSYRILYSSCDSAKHW
jgi:hypothetical protein